MPTLYPSKMFVGANLVTECNFIHENKIVSKTYLIWGM